MTMKRTLAAAAALLITTVSGYAADLPVKALLSPAPVWSWTGFYGGVHVGAGWAPPSPPSPASLLRRPASLFP